MQADRIEGQMEWNNVKLFDFKIKSWAEMNQKKLILYDFMVDQ